MDSSRLPGPRCSETLPGHQFLSGWTPASPRCPPPPGLTLPSCRAQCQHAAPPGAWVPHCLLQVPGAHGGAGEGGKRARPCAPQTSYRLFSEQNIPWAPGSARCRHCPIFSSFPSSQPLRGSRCPGGHEPLDSGQPHATAPRGWLSLCSRWDSSHEDVSGGRGVP